MIKFHFKHLALLPCLLMMATSTKSMPPKRNNTQFVCVHQSTYFNLINFLTKSIAKIFKDPHKKNWSFYIPKFNQLHCDLKEAEKKNHEETFYLVNESLESLTNEYLSQMKDSDCTSQLCAASKIDPKTFYIIFKRLKDKANKARYANAKSSAEGCNAKSSAEDCKTKEEFAGYLLALLNYWGNFSSLNNLFHVDGKLFRERRTPEEYKFIEEEPKHLQALIRSRKHANEGQAQTRKVQKAQVNPDANQEKPCNAT